MTRNPDVKAAIVERFNRTLKEKMWRYFTYKNSKHYIDVLQDLVRGYNNGYHSTIKMAPSSVTVFNASTAKKNMDSRYKTVERKATYAVGNLVRISRTKGTFENRLYGELVRRNF